MSKRLIVALEIDALDITYEQYMTEPKWLHKYKLKTRKARKDYEESISK